MIKGKKVSILIMAMLCVLCIVTACGKSGIDGSPETGNAGVKTIRIGSNRALGSVTPYLAEKMGYFDGKNYKVEVIEFTDGAAIMEAMAAGEIEMGLVGVAPVATWNAKGFDVRVVASANTGGHAIISKKGSGIKTVEDLKGKTMAGPNVGTVTDALLKAYILPRYNMTEKDLTIVTGMKPVDMVNTLLNTDELDAIMTWEPYVSMAEIQGSDTVIIYDASEEYKKNSGSDTVYPTNVVAASGELCDENPEIVQDIVSIIGKTADYVKENEEEANQEIAEILELEADIIAKSRNRSDLTFEIDIDATMEVLNWACELGYIEKLPSKEDLFDLRFISKNS